ncbi:hydroxyquinol 1,2-dioxygenase [uncultured Ralstonia sp.]|jgi:hypothetical protein|uniref:hydroxyquinol 1,2-dioxygenase n=1 Tax=Ralstonia sp. TaxID=54061 RepID=UPI001EA5C91E|nr:hydroxyquinol 1,2-dioxygenase [uncultured Ralstonia sp.]UCF22024.1 MAG: hydroxyquinol 1,2-dioxygenase [Ralstonia sp.]
MTRNLIKPLVAVALAVAAVGAVAAPSYAGARDPYTEGARSVQDARDAYAEGARSADIYTDGARSADPYYDGAHA